MTHGWQAPFGAERAGLLEEVARALSRAGDFESTVRAAGRSMVPGFADLVITVVRRERMEDWLEVSHADPAEESGIGAAVEELLPAIKRVASADLRQGRTFRWIPTFSQAAAQFLRREPALGQYLHDLGVHSLMVVPLRSSGTILGGMGFIRISARPAFHAADLAVAQVIARSAAVRIQGAELHGRALDEQTRRKRLERALHKWIRVFDSAGWGAAIVDGQDQRIEAVNPGFASLHGYPSPNSLGGRLFSDLLPPERINEPMRWLTQDPSYESVHVRADGSLFPVLINVTPLATDAEVTSYVVTVQDLTELKRAEERLRGAQRLEAVGRLAGGVAHEVNNMMTIILGFSELLTRSGGISVEHQREIEEIRKAATRAGRVTQQLLAFSRRQLLQPADLQVNEVVADLLPVLKLLLPANITLETSLAPLGPLVYADRAQLDQVIINLAFNARDAMGSGGTLRLITDSRRLDEGDGRRLIGISIPAGEYALISVVDTGHGMDSATLEQVFEPFFTTKPAGSGTGLGLATVYGIVKQSGGYVWIESLPGTGTTVTVCLPQIQREASVPDEAEAGSRTAECPTGTVLIVEDEEGVRELALRVLEQQGHRVLQARDGETALSTVAEYGPELDLMLSDVIVPGIATAELEQQVRDRCPDLPILYMSGYSRDEMVGRGVIDPDRPFLQKPFTAAELSELVCRQLEVGRGPVVGR